MGADGAVRPVAYHGSGHVTAYTDADALAVMPEGVGEMAVGEGVELLLLR
jgi:molybdopterin biosynthesis enzyme